VAGSVTVAGGGTLPSDLFGKTGGRLVLTARPTNTVYGARLDVGGDLTILANGWIYPLTSGTNGAAGTTNAIVGIRVLGDVAVAAGGGIRSDGAGYIPVHDNNNGPGAGTVGCGGGYGGAGGGTTGGQPYGTNSMPFEPGSPGARFTDYNSGKGGGSVHVVANGSMTIDGLVSADGHYGVYYGGAGGSGGSVFLCSSADLTGSGTLRACGGARDSQNGYNGDGGGGRIAVWRCFDMSTVDARIAARNDDDLDYYASLPVFTGSWLVDHGGTAGSDGTKGYYETPPQGTVISIR
jgi:hypothetical protein